MSISKKQRHSMPSLSRKKPRHITARSIALVDATGKTRVLLDAGSADGHASICLFAKDGRSIQISTQPNGGLVIALLGKRCVATLGVNADEDGQLTISDRRGLLGTTLGSVYEPGQHRLTLFHKGRPYWSTPRPRKQWKKKKRKR